ncbi:MAG: hypothetical protein MR755_02475 [Faecalibacterium sp.]|nr:hypothetical protein [Faecalibacterium sp.]
MSREQHYAGLHYRSKFQIGATNVTNDEDDYFDGSDQKFQFRGLSQILCKVQTAIKQEQF